MIVSPENRPFRFYNDDDKDKYGYKIPNTDIEIVKDVLGIL